MELKGRNIGFAITGSFCTFDKILKQIDILKKCGANIIPIMSYNAYNLDTRFRMSKEFIDDVKKITGNDIINTIQKAEVIGPSKLFDIMIIAPCTGNTAAKLCNGIIDTPVLMAAKAHIRNNRPLVISISTNDALGINLQNIGKLMIIKNVYFVPFGQDDPINKPFSMIADVTQINKTLEHALEYKQLQPIII
ncbi:MAG: dipicolinate synthase subunit B [Lachnospiraceae bacterium]|nr:dipicolinate synthase subunit B [Lachnospiraceae bacterium]